ncbi:MAG TPA: response regulator transcription factor [Chitinophagaceae bacterium]|nr:response regulator transcription factor [Chitinophagaceae bacterium]
MTLRILIADDHEVIRQGLRQILREEFPQAIIEEAADGDVLLEKATAANWDIVISDISMPGMSGMQALKRILQVHPELPVLIISIHPEDQYAHSVLKAGAAGYLCKDAAITELVKAVKKILSGEKYIAPSVK